MLLTDSISNEIILDILLLRYILQMEKIIKLLLIFPEKILLFHLKIDILI